MSTLAEQLRLPGWVRRVDPVAWFPVAAFVVVAAVCALADNLWLTFGAIAAAALIVALEAMVFGPDRPSALPQPPPAPHPAPPAHRPLPPGTPAPRPLVPGPPAPRPLVPGPAAPGPPAPGVPTPRHPPQLRQPANGQPGTRL